MPTITAIKTSRRRPNRRIIHLDGAFAFSLHVNVVARFHLREGMALTEHQVRQIEQGQVRQECLDHAIRFLETRLHSRQQLRTKLMRREFGQAIIEDVLDELARMGYVDDARFALNLAQSAAQHRHHGRRRAMVELLRSGIDRATAERALEDVYDTHDSMDVARQLAKKQAPRLRRLDPQTARRRLAGMLLRRGYDYDTIRPVIEEVLGPDPQE